MIRYTRPILALCAVLALAACEQQKAPAPAPASPAPSSTPAQPSSPPPAATPAPASTPAATAGASIGVPECDEYLTKYEACLSGKVPESAREQLRTGLEQTRNAWRSAAANEATKASLGAACKQAHDGAKAALSAYGCTDF